MKPTKILTVALLFAIVAASSLSPLFADDASNSFTVVLIPDSQNYCCQEPENNRYVAQMKWIAENAGSEEH